MEGRATGVTLLKSDNNITGARAGITNSIKA
jgi:hypothetical protein